MIIYKITNLINNKVYIGKTTEGLDRRRKRHLMYLERGIEQGIVLYQALSKYGINSFTWDILYEANDRNELSEKEKFFIIENHSHITQHGYNMTWGGDGGSWDKTHPRYNEIIRNRSGQNNSFFGKHHTPDQIEKWKASRRGRPMKDEQKILYSKIFAGENNPMFGRHHSMETKEKIRNKLKGKVSWKKGVKCSEETKKKISESKMGENHPMFGKCHTAETKKKMSSIKKEYWRKKHEDSIMERT